MTIHYIKPTFFMDANSYLILGKGKTLLIDTGTGMKLDSLITSLNEILAGRKLDYIIATHRHHDHAGGVSKLVSLFGSEAFMSEIDGIPIKEGDSVSTLAAPFGLKIEPVNVKYLKEGDKIDLGGYILRVLETPGHTIGSICLYDETSGALFAGDTISLDGVKRLDTPTASHIQLGESLRKLSELKVNGIYPGHGAPAEKGTSSKILKSLKILELLYSDD